MAHQRVADAVFAIFQPPRQAAQPAPGALQRNIVPTAAGAGVKRLLMAAPAGSVIGHGPCCV